jgi:hypothetical protein
MRRGNRAGLEVTIERSRGPEKIGNDASALSALWIPRISHEVLRDLGMSDDAIARYFCRFPTRPIGAVRASSPAQTRLRLPCETNRRSAP